MLCLLDVDTDVMRQGSLARDDAPEHGGTFKSFIDRRARREQSNALDSEPLTR